MIMKANSWTAPATLLLVAWLASPAVAQTTATVIRDRVNVRAQPTIFSEVVTRLREGDTVVILGETNLAKRKAGEPAQWARIQMPTNTPVWVNTNYIDLGNKTVTATRLNLRAGHGEDFSVVGQLTKDTEVKEILVQGDWMQIETPTNAYAYVASEFLEKKAAAEPAPLPSEAPKTEPAPEAKPAPAAPPPAPAEKAVEPAPTPAPKAEAPAAPSAAAPAALEPAKAVAPEPAKEAAPEAPKAAAPEAPKAAEKELILAREQKAAETVPVPAVKEETPLITEAAPAPAPVAKRIVRREGIVKTTGLQAPTQLQLVSADTGKAINYLQPKTPEQNLKTFKGRRVVVTGEELIDPHWPKTPVLAVETIELAP